MPPVETAGFGLHQELRRWQKSGFQTRVTREGIEIKQARDKKKKNQTQERKGKETKEQKTRSETEKAGRKAQKPSGRREQSLASSSTPRAAPASDGGKATSPAPESRFPGRDGCRAGEGGTAGDFAEEEGQR